MMIRYINRSYQLYSLRGPKEKSLEGERTQQTEGEWRYKQQTSVQLQSSPPLWFMDLVRAAGVVRQAIYD